MDHIFVEFMFLVQKQKITLPTIVNSVCLKMEKLTKIRVWPIQEARSALKSLNTIEESLMKFGLSRNESKIYLFLARAGAKKAKEISDALSLYRTETYRALKNLEKNGLILSIFGRPLKFKAVPLEKAVDFLIKMKKLQIERLKQEKKKMIEIWQRIPKFETEYGNRNEVFQMLEGDGQIALKIDEILDRSKNEIFIYASEFLLKTLYNTGLTDKLKEASMRGAKIAILTSDSPEVLFFLRKLRSDNINFKILPREKSMDSTINMRPLFFLISDGEELLLLLRGSSYLSKRKKLNSKVLWTNCCVLVKTFHFLFLELEKYAW